MYLCLLVPTSQACPWWDTPALLFARAPWRDWWHTLYHSSQLCQKHSVWWKSQSLWPKPVFKTALADICPLRWPPNLLCNVISPASVQATTPSSLWCKSTQYMSSDDVKFTLLISPIVLYSVCVNCGKAYSGMRGLCPVNASSRNGWKLTLATLSHTAYLDTCFQFVLNILLMITWWP